MQTISNTSPLLNLAIIGQLDLLREQFGEVTIPVAVLQELRVDEALPGSSALRQALEDGWIRVQQVEDRDLVHLLQRALDDGEAEAIALAAQTKAAWLLLDERDGRLAAKTLGLHVTGVLGILLRAQRDGDVPSLRKVMEKLQAQAGFHIASALFEELLISVDESTQG